jgi:hypothetical protein
MSSAKVVLPVLLFLTSPVSAEEPFKVEWKDRLLTVAAEKASLAPILREIVKQTRIDVQGLDSLQDDEVSMRFERLSLGDGLQRLLGRSSYAMVEFLAPQDGTPPLMLIIGGKAVQKPGPRPDERAGAQEVIEPRESVGLEDWTASQEATPTPILGGKAVQKPGPRPDERAGAQEVIEPRGSVGLEDWTRALR